MKFDTYILREVQTRNMTKQENVTKDNLDESEGELAEEYVLQNAVIDDNTDDQFISDSEMQKIESLLEVDHKSMIEKQEKDLDLREIKS